jgi:Domain of unknown function DUF29
VAAKEGAMATKLGTKPSELYDADFYVWSEVQAELLRERRFDDLDLQNLIEEVEDLGGALKRSVLTNATVVVEHLLKLQYSPADEPRAGWVDSVLEHRNRLEYDLTPRLRQILADDMRRVYTLARRSAERKLRLHGEHTAADALPPACPYSLDQITGDWWP